MSSIAYAKVPAWEYEEHGQTYLKPLMSMTQEELVSIYMYILATGKKKAYKRYILNELKKKDSNN